MARYGAILYGVVRGGTWPLLTPLKGLLSPFLFAWPKECKGETWEGSHRGKNEADIVGLFTDLRNHFYPRCAFRWTC